MTPVQRARGVQILSRLLSFIALTGRAGLFLTKEGQMTNELTIYDGGFPVSREVRRTGRAISRYQAGGQVRVAAVDTDTDVALAKVDASTATTGHAMTAVVRVAQLQKSLELLAPDAAGRLAFLADDHMLSMSEVVADLRRELRRK
jgi:hypothetical protein